MRYLTMVPVAFTLLTCWMTSSIGDDALAASAWPSGLPVYDHVVIVVEENKSYEQIIGNSAAPYINSILKAEGASFTQLFAEEHASQGNYFWLFSGSNQAVGFTDVIPSTANNPKYPFMARNLGEQLLANYESFKGYSESLPSIGFQGDFSPDRLYARKHVPWISFGNIPNGHRVATSVNLRFADFPRNFHRLPTVSIVVPNQNHDMHNGDPTNSISVGDAWLKDNLDPYYQWAKHHNSLLILTFDEDDDGGGILGLTDPFSTQPGIQNHIVTIFAGAHIKAGDYSEGQGITHVNVLRTLEAMYGLQRSGHQQVNACLGGISNSYVVTDVFKPAPLQDRLRFLFRRALNFVDQTFLFSAATQP